MSQVAEQQAKQEEDRNDMAKKKLQYVMEQAPVFGQLYIHIERLGHQDNIPVRTDAMMRASLEVPKEEGQEHDEDVEIVIQNMDSSLNNRATGTEEENQNIKIAGTTDPTDSLARAEQTNSLKKKKIVQPKRNFYVQYKTFPELESMKTGTVW